MARVGFPTNAAVIQREMNRRLWTIKALSDSSGVHYRTCIKVMQGTAVSAETLAKIEAAFAENPVQRRVRRLAV